MEILESNWIGLAPPVNLTDPDDLLEYVSHVELVEEKVHKPHRDKYLAFWCRRGNQSVLRHYYSRTLHHPDADAILRELLGIACGGNSIWEAQSWRAAYMLLAILTSPACAHIPVESYPALARSIISEVRQFNCADQATLVAIKLKLAADIAAATAGGEANGGASCGTRPASDPGAAGPSGR